MNLQDKVFNEVSNYFDVTCPSAMVKKLSDKVLNRVNIDDHYAIQVAVRDVLEWAGWLESVEMEESSIFDDINSLEDYEENYL